MIIILHTGEDTKILLSFSLALCSMEAYDEIRIKYIPMYGGYHDSRNYRGNHTLSHCRNKRTGLWSSRAQSGVGRQHYGRSPLTWGWRDYRVYSIARRSKASRH